MNQDYSIFPTKHSINAEGSIYLRSDGMDNENCGSEESPCLSLNTAVAALSTNNEIIIDDDYSLSTDFTSPNLEWVLTQSTTGSLTLSGEGCMIISAKKTKMTHRALDISLKPGDGVTHPLYRVESGTMVFSECTLTLSTQSIKSFIEVSNGKLILQENCAIIATSLKSPFLSVTGGTAELSPVTTWTAHSLETELIILTRGTVGLTSQTLLVDSSSTDKLFNVEGGIFTIQSCQVGNATMGVPVTLTSISGGVLTLSETNTLSIVTPFSPLFSISSGNLNVEPGTEITHSLDTRSAPLVILRNTGTGSFTKTTIPEMTLSSSGGLFSLSDSSSLSLTEITFRNIQNLGTGSLLTSTSSGSLTLQTMEFQSISTSNSGSVLNMASSGTLSMTEVSFTDNSCGSSGKGRSVFIDHSSLSKNKLVLSSVTVTSSTTIGEHEIFFKGKNVGQVVNSEWASFIGTESAQTQTTLSAFWGQDTADSSQTGPLAYSLYPFTSGSLHVREGFWDHTNCGKETLPCSSIEFGLSKVGVDSSTVLVDSDNTLDDLMSISSIETTMKGTTEPTPTVSVSSNGRIAVKVPFSLSLLRFVGASAKTTPLLVLSTGSLSIESCSFSNLQSSTSSVLSASLSSSCSLTITSTSFVSCSSSQSDGGVVWIEAAPNTPPSSLILHATFSECKCGTGKTGEWVFVNGSRLSALIVPSSWSTTTAGLTHNLDKSKLWGADSEPTHQQFASESLLMHLLTYSAASVFVGVELGRDVVGCGEETSPCASLATGFAHLDSSETTVLTILDSTSLNFEILSNRTSQTMTGREDPQKGLTVETDGKITANANTLFFSFLSFTTEVPSFSHSLFTLSSSASLHLTSCSFSSFSSTTNGSILSGSLGATQMLKLHTITFSNCHSTLNGESIHLNMSSCTSSTNYKMISLSFLPLTPPSTHFWILGTDFSSFIIPSKWIGSYSDATYQELWCEPTDSSPQHSLMAYFVLIIDTVIIKGSGTDDETCGSVFLPCKTVKGGYEQISSKTGEMILFVMSDCDFGVNITIPSQMDLTIEGDEAATTAPIIALSPTDGVHAITTSLKLSALTFSSSSQSSASFITITSTSQLTIKSCSFIGVDCSERGSVVSGALSDQKPFSITNTTFSNCRSDGDGGVIHLVAEESTPSSNLVLKASFVDCACGEGCRGDWVFVEGTDLVNLIEPSNWEGTFNTLSFAADKNKLWGIDTTRSDQNYGNSTLLVYLLFFSGENISVSSEQGLDVLGCGEESTPCQSISHSLTHLAVGETNELTLRGSLALNFEMLSNRTNLKVSGRLDPPDLKVEADGKITATENTMMFDTIHFISEETISRSFIFVSDSAIFTIQISDFTGFSSSSSGSVLSAALTLSSSLTVTGCSFFDSNSTENGGIMFISCPDDFPSTSLVLSDLTFSSTCSCAEGKHGEWIFIEASDLLNLLVVDDWSVTVSDLQQPADNNKVWGSDISKAEQRYESTTLLVYLMAFSSDKVWVSADEGLDVVGCGDEPTPCQTLSTSFARLSDDETSTLTLLSSVSLNFEILSNHTKLILLSPESSPHSIDVEEGGKVTADANELSLSYLLFSTSQQVITHSFITLTNTALLSITHCHFSGFHSSVSGSVISAVLTMSSCLLIENCDFKECSSTADGGVISVSCHPTFPSTNLTISSSFDSASSCAAGKLGEWVYVTGTDLSQLIVPQKWSTTIQNLKQPTDNNKLWGLDANRAGESFESVSLLVYLLNFVGDDVWVTSVNGKDEIGCGEEQTPCATLSTAITHLNDAETNTITILDSATLNFELLSNHTSQTFTGLEEPRKEVSVTSDPAITITSNEINLSFLSFLSSNTDLSRSLITITADGSLSITNSSFSSFHSSQNGTIISGSLGETQHLLLRFVSFLQCTSSTNASSVFLDMSACTASTEYDMKSLSFSEMGEESKPHVLLLGTDFKSFIVPSKWRGSFSESDSCSLWSVDTAADRSESLLVYLIEVTNRINVGGPNEVDADPCGTKERPCKTVGFGFTMVSDWAEPIVISVNDDSVFQSEMTITIDKNLTIVGDQSLEPPPTVSNALGDSITITQGILTLKYLSFNPGVQLTNPFLRFTNKGFLTIVECFFVGFEGTCEGPVLSTVMDTTAVISITETSFDSCSSTQNSGVIKIATVGVIPSSSLVLKATFTNCESSETLRGTWVCVVGENLVDFIDQTNWEGTYESLTFESDKSRLWGIDSSRSGKCFGESTLLVYLKQFSADSIYISAAEGMDVIGCGEETSPCASLATGFERLDSSETTVLTILDSTSLNFEILSNRTSQTMTGREDPQKGLTVETDGKITANANTLFFSFLSFTTEVPSFSHSLFTLSSSASLHLTSCSFSSFSSTTNGSILSGSLGATQILKLHTITFTNCHSTLNGKSVHLNMSSCTSSTDYEMISLTFNPFSSSSHHVWIFGSNFSSYIKPSKWTDSFSRDRTNELWCEHAKDSTQHTLTVYFYDVTNTVLVDGTEGRDVPLCGDTLACKTIAGAYQQIRDKAGQIYLVVNTSCNFNVEITIPIDMDLIIRKDVKVDTSPTITLLPTDGVTIVTTSFSLINMTINTSSDGGRSFIVLENNGGLTIESCSFQGLVRSEAGSVVSGTLGASKMFSIEDTTFTKCRSDGNGGVVNLIVEGNTLPTSLVLKASFMDCACGEGCCGDWVFIERTNLVELIQPTNWEGTYEALSFATDKNKLWGIDSSLSGSRFEEASLLVYLLDYSSPSIWTSSSEGRNFIGCGEEGTPCQALGFAKTHLQLNDSDVLTILDSGKLDSLFACESISLTVTGTTEPLKIIEVFEDGQITASQFPATFSFLSFTTEVQVFGRSLFTITQTGSLSLLSCRVVGFHSTVSGSVVSASLSLTSSLIVRACSFSTCSSTKDGGVISLSCPSNFPSSNLVIDSTFDSTCTCSTERSGEWVFISAHNFSTLLAPTNWTATVTGLSQPSENNKLWGHDSAYSGAPFNNVTLLLYLVNYSSDTVYVSKGSKSNDIGCGSETFPCQTISVAVAKLNSADLSAVIVLDSADLNSTLQSASKNFILTGAATPQKQIPVLAPGSVKSDKNTMTLSFLSFSTNLPSFSRSLVTITKTGSLTLQNCSFSKFSSNVSGSVISMSSTATTPCLLIQNCHFSECKSARNGGVMSLSFPANFPSSGLVIDSIFDPTCTCSSGYFGEWIYLTGRGFSSLLAPSNWTATVNGLSQPTDNNKLWGNDTTASPSTFKNVTLLLYLVTYSSETVFASSNGLDLRGCGAQATPCLTLATSLTKLIGQDEPTIRVVTQVSLSQSFTSPSSGLVLKGEEEKTTKFEMLSSGRISVTKSSLSLSSFAFTVTATRQTVPFTVSADGVLHIENCSFANYTCSADIAFISVLNSASLAISQSRFTNITVHTTRPIILSSSTGPLSIDETKFESCVACVSTSKGTLELSKSVFSFCLVSLDGLISYATEDPIQTTTLLLNECTFENITHSSSQSDSAIIHTSQSLTITNTNFTTCTKSLLTVINVNGTPTSMPTVEISGSIFDSTGENLLETGSFITINMSDSVTIANSTFQHIQSSTDGSIMLIANSTSATLDSLIVSNVSTTAEGLFTLVNISSTTSIRSCKLDRTISQYSTFVIASSSCTVNISSTNFTECVATVGSGVLYSTTHLLCEHCAFRNCYGLFAADSIFIADPNGLQEVTVSVVNCSFDGPGSDIRRRGACLSFQNTSSVVLKTLRFAGIHTQSIQGGAVMCRQTKTFVCEACSFDRIQSSFGSGMYIYEVEQSVSISLSNFTNCSSSQRAGALSFRFALVPSNLNVINCIFTNCTSLMSAGAAIIHSDTGSASDTSTVRICTFSGCEFIGCSSLQGGALHLVWNSVHPAQIVKLLSSQFSGNTATNSGGSVYVEEKYSDSSTVNGSLIIEQSTFLSNECQNRDKWENKAILLETICGGAIYALADTPTMNGERDAGGREGRGWMGGRNAEKPNSDNYHIIITESSFTNNRNTSIALYYSSALIQTTNFSSNSVSFNSNKVSMAAGCRTAKLHVHNGCGFSPQRNLLCNPQCNLNHPSPDGFLGCYTVLPSNLEASVEEMDYTLWPSLQAFHIKAEGLLELTPKAMISATDLSNKTSNAETRRRTNRYPKHAMRNDDKGTIQLDVSFSTGSTDTVIIPQTNLSTLSKSIPAELFFYLSSDGGNTWSSDAAIITIKQQKTMNRYIVVILGASLGTVAVAAGLIIIMCCVYHHRQKNKLDRWHRMQKGYQEMVTAPLHKFDDNSAYYDY
ncbi:hypothetical protein BLNAU_16243 [Blattamonas nauphoetae]|uniref:Uncharacterized protein n=1 Tax=Blattamonas nauphoetae TaxID=2049346 RepID=A0ABQ9X8K2_9EUKA|nr:hypothetical protein BLNAU_16243 [Blattamonas nauphoetae]